MFLDNWGTAQLPNAILPQKWIWEPGEPFKRSILEAPTAVPSWTMIPSSVGEGIGPDNWEMGQHKPTHSHVGEFGNGPNRRNGQPWIPAHLHGTGQWSTQMLGDNNSGQVGMEPASTATPPPQWVWGMAGALKR